MADQISEHIGIELVPVKYAICPDCGQAEDKPGYLEDGVHPWRSRWCGHPFHSGCGGGFKIMCGGCKCDLGDISSRLAPYIRAEDYAHICA